MIPRILSPVLIVRLAYFVIFLGAGVWLPYAPLYLASLGFDGWQIGIVGTLTMALRWASAITLGWVADRHRNRRRLLVATAALGAVCFVPLLWVRDFASVVLVVSAISVFHGTLIPMVDATVVDHLPALGNDYGRLRLWGSVSFIVGAAGSAALVRLHGPDVVPLLLLLPNCVVAPVLALLPASQAGHPERVRAPWSLVTPALAAFLATVFLTQTSAGAFQGFFALHVRALGLPDSVPGVTFALSVTIEVALFHWGRRVLDWIAPTRLLWVAVLVTAVRWAFAAVVTAEASVIAVQLAHVFTFSALHLASVALVARLVPQENATSGQSLYGLVGYGVGGTVGTALAGALVDRLGTSRLFWFEAAVACAALVPAAALGRLLPPRQ
jgi:PPP family 3-phenylpropionic acid transporter